MRLRIANGTLGSPRGSARTDVVCRGGTIERVGDTDRGSVNDQIDASGRRAAALCVRNTEALSRAWRRDRARRLVS
jgi:hypothetical protein